MSMWRWTKVKKATIPREQRDIFERYGENVIGMLLASGLNPATGELHSIYASDSAKANARDWLTERSTWHERREDRLEFLEVAILIFVLGELLLDFAHSFRWLR